MTISSLGDYALSLKQTVLFNRKSLGIAAGTPVAYSSWQQSGFPSAGGTPGNTANGLVPTNLTAGAAAIMPFGGTGYITSARGSATAIASPSMIVVYDRLFHCGPYVAGSGTTNLTAQPSFSSRIPGGTDYTGLVMFVETGTVAGCPTSVVITYTDQAGNTGHSTPSVNTPFAGSNTLASARVALASGDSGVRKIESVTPTGGSGSGSLVIVIARPLIAIPVLAHGNVNFVSPEAIQPLDQTGMPQVWSDSCLYLMGNCDAQNISVDVSLEIASK